MKKLAFLIFLALGADAMARDLGTAPANTDPRTGLDQAGDRIVDLLRKGDIEGARRQYEQDQKAFGLQPTQPPRRSARPSLGAPMTLPPEAR